MTDWASLRDAYGSAEDVLALLVAAEEAGPNEEGPWDELWSRLCHQGTVYSASYAALPALAKMGRQRDPGGYAAALYLAAAMIASIDGPEDSASVRLRYESEVAGLRAVAALNLQDAKDDPDFVYGLQALMAFEDGGAWQRRLHCLADGELELDCPSCAEHLLVDLDGQDYRAQSFADDSLGATTVTPVEPPAATAEGRLLAVARASGRFSVANKMPYLFGTATCPRCHASFGYPKRSTDGQAHSAAMTDAALGL